MKQMILLLFAAFLCTATADAQSFSGEWRREGSGELDSKMWVTNGMMRTESDQSGEKRIMIFRKDSMSVFILNPVKKTYMNIPISSLNASSLVGLDIKETRSSDREFLRDDVFDGRACQVYRITSRSKIEDLDEESISWTEWFCDELKGPNYSGSVKTDNTAYSMDRTIVLKNIKKGPQPASLFVIPKDYQGMTLPLGGMLEMFTGKSREQNQKDADKARKEIKEGMEDIRKQLEDIENSGSDDEKLRKALEMLGTAGKKK